MPTETVSALRERVGDHLRQSDLDATLDDEGDYVVRSPVGSATVWIRAADWRDGHTVVRVWAITNMDVRIDGELTRFLMNTNAQWPMGGFQLNEDGPAVIVAHSLVGDFLNRHELQAAVAAVAGAAALFSGQIRDRFGGTIFGES